MIGDEAQLTLDNVPNIKSYSANEDREVSGKIAAIGAQICVERIGSVLNRTLTTRTSATCCSSGHFYFSSW